MGVMSIMDREAGDIKVIWDADNEDEVESAREQFDSMREKGYMAYSVGSRGKKGQQIREFDPAAESLILAPALRGG